MMVMTAKVDMKRILIALAAVVGVVVALILLLSGGNSTETAAPNVSDNDARVQFLKDFGWDISTTPKESSQVRIPKDSTEIFDRYNALQKSQGYDLTGYAGKTVMRYVYQVNNYPGATEPVYATLLVFKNQVIGGDITNTAAKGNIQGFQMLTTQPSEPAKTPDSTEPTDATAPIDS